MPQLPGKEQRRFDAVFNSEVIHLPQIKIASNYHYNAGPTTLHETACTSPFHRGNQVVLTFLIKGNIRSTYGGLKHTFHHTDLTCSFVYGPQENYHALADDQHINSVAIGVDKCFFAGLNQEDPWMDKLLSQIEKGVAFSPTKGSYPISPGVSRLLQDIRQADHQGSLRRLYQHARVSELLMLQIEDIRREENPVPAASMQSRDTDSLYDLRNYLDKHFLDELTLDQLARLIGSNTFKVKTGFKTLFGKTVFEYIRDLRMQHAASLLLDHNKTIGDVADILGYEHVQHFSSAFKKYFGAAPTKYQIIRPA